MFKLLCITNLLTFFISIVAAGNIGGYHYEKPSLSLNLVAGTSHLGHGHSFGPIPTVQPLPPVPALPPLPTPRSKAQFLQTQLIYQTHPGSYVSSPDSTVGKIAHQYQPPLLAQHTIISPIRSQPTGTGFSSPSTGIGSNPPNPAPARIQPLRIPFNKQAVIGITSGPENPGIYQANGRQLKQYAVIEIIDNDIEESTQPFRNTPFFDNYRAHGGASSTGTGPASLTGIQLSSRSNAARLEQQRLPSNNDAVALGSGGLGFIRLANGNVYLGSGSLGYISGQQHTQDIHEARTRSGASQPDALHFGHGSLGTSNVLNRFPSFRFN